MKPMHRLMGFNHKVISQSGTHVRPKCQNHSFIQNKHEPVKTGFFMRYIIYSNGTIKRDGAKPENKMAEQLSMFDESESQPVNVYIITFDVGSGKQTIQTKPMNETELNEFVEFMDVMGIWYEIEKKD
jgi:hypothetical protein